MAIYIIDAKKAKLHVSKGNRKIGKGIYSFSTLPGNEKHLLYVKNKGLLTSVPGTCSKYCEECAKDGCCYAWRDAKLHSNACIPAWGENTVLLRENPNKLFEDIHLFIADKNKKYYNDPCDKNLVVRTWRWHVSGEIESLDQLVRMKDIAIQHPEVQFGVYTKNFDVLREYLEKYKVDSIPQNFVINVSEWHGVARDFLKDYPGLFNVFEYDDHNKKDCTLSAEEIARLEKTPHCPAVARDGHHRLDANGNPITCDHCGRCYRRTGQTTAVWSH